MTTLALTDRDTVAGTVRFATAAAAAGIRPLFGVDIAVAPLPGPAAAPDRPRTPVRGGAHVVEPPLRITLLAQTTAGWARLCRLVSAAHAQAARLMPNGHRRHHCDKGVENSRVTQRLTVAAVTSNAPNHL